MNMPAQLESSPFLGNILLFARALRRAGLPVSLDQTLGLVGALDWLDLSHRAHVYHAARALLVTRRDDLPVFEAVFQSFFHGPMEMPRRRPKPPSQRPRGGEPAFTIATYMAHKARPSDKEIAVADRSETYSSLETLQGKDFSEMTPEELAVVRELIRKMRFDVSQRKTRRLVPDSSGRAIDMARILRETARRGALPLDLPRCSEKIKQRPVVLLADISGSMERYSRLMLQFFYSFSHSLRQVESFVFATRLSRVTPHLGLRNVDHAIEMASRRVIDWAGGTRIGASLRAFNREWGRRVLRRGAIVIVVSDGWERGDSELLGREMRYLHHRCHRLIWLNPLAGREGFRPRTQGMVAALPHVDDFLPVHNLQSLGQLAEHLRSLPRRRTGFSSSVQSSLVSLVSPLPSIQPKGDLP